LLDAGPLQAFQTLNQNSAGSEQVVFAVVHERKSELCWLKASINKAR